MERPVYYILDGKIPVEEKDLYKWGKWFETADRNIKETTLSNGIIITTTFLGLDHSLFKDNPMLFETHVYDSNNDKKFDYQAGYATWDEAEEGHERAVRFIEGQLIINEVLKK